MDKWEQKKNRLAVLIEKRNSVGVTREEAKEIHEIQKQFWAHNKFHNTGYPERCKSRQMFGRPLRELTREERRLYENALARKNANGEMAPPFGTTLTRQMFGKPLKELTRYERAEYIKALKERRKKK